MELSVCVVGHVSLPLSRSAIYTTLQSAYKYLFRYCVQLFKLLRLIWYDMICIGRSVSLKSLHIDIRSQFQVTRWCVILSIDVCSSMASTFPPQCYIEPTNSINRKHYTWLCTWEGRGINRPPYLLAGMQREEKREEGRLRDSIILYQKTDQRRKEHIVCNVINYLNDCLVQRMTFKGMGHS